MRQTKEEEWFKAWEGFNLPLLTLEMRKTPWAKKGSSLWMLARTREQFQASVQQGTRLSQHLDFNPVRRTVFHSSYIHVDFCSCQGSRNATHTNPTRFISLLDMCTFYQHIPPSATDERERTERKKLPSFSLSLLSSVFSINCWLLQGSNTKLLWVFKPPEMWGKRETYT